MARPGPVSRSSRKSVIRSFRVDQSALEIIEKDAQEKNISVNTLVNQLILAYVNLDRYLDQFPMIKIASEGFGLLLDGASDEYAKEAARRLALNLVQSQIMSRRGDLSLSTILEHFRTVSEYSKVFTSRKPNQTERKSLPFITDMVARDQSGSRSTLFRCWNWRARIRRSGQPKTRSRRLCSTCRDSLQWSFPDSSCSIPRKLASRGLAAGLLGLQFVTRHTHGARLRLVSRPSPLTVCKRRLLTTTGQGASLRFSSRGTVLSTPATRREWMPCTIQI